MTLNRIIPTSIILEVIMISTQVSTLYFDTCDYDSGSNHSTFVTFMVNFFTTTVALFLLLSVLWIYYFRMHNYAYTNNVRKLRGVQGLVLILIGALSLGTAQGMWRVDESGKHCATVFEITVVGGATAILDGILYFIRPTRKGGRNIFACDPTPVPAVPPRQNNNGIFIIQHDLPAYEAPPSYADLTIDQLRGIQSQSQQLHPSPATN